MVRSGPCRSRAENVLNLHTLLHTLFEKYPETGGLRPYTETQKSHRQGRAIVRPYLFRKTHKGFQRVDSSTNKENNYAISCTHFLSVILIFIEIEFIFIS